MKIHFRQKDNLECLGAKKIDWKNDKLEKIKKVLEEKGCKHNQNLGNYENIKTFIMNTLAKIKKGSYVQLSDLDKIYNNLNSVDHFDCVRIDQILTIDSNRNESDFQWASICMNKKWKTL